MYESDQPVKDFHCPRWDELPSIPLYMDQVLLVLNGTLEPLTSAEDARVTAAMINNYVKQKLVAPPLKKKYGREQLSRLIILCLLKRVLSISEISLLFQAMNTQAPQEFHTLFCGALEAALRQGLEGGMNAMAQFCDTQSGATLCAALLSLSGRIYVECALKKKTDAE